MLKSILALVCVGFVAGLTLSSFASIAGGLACNCTTAGAGTATCNQCGGATIHTGSNCNVCCETTAICKLQPQ